MSIIIGSVGAVNDIIKKIFSARHKMTEPCFRYFSYGTCDGD
jgi:hypothetical protein